MSQLLQRVIDRYHGARMLLDGVRLRCGWMGVFFLVAYVLPLVVVVGFWTIRLSAGAGAAAYVQPTDWTYRLTCSKCGFAMGMRQPPRATVRTRGELVQCPRCRAIAARVVPGDTSDAANKESKRPADRS